MTNISTVEVLFHRKIKKLFMLILREFFFHRMPIEIEIGIFILTIHHLKHQSILATTVTKSHHYLLYSSRGKVFSKVSEVSIMDKFNTQENS
jgi:hypothetical protein